MDNRKKRAGQSTRDLARKRRARAWIIAIIGLVAVALIWFLLKNSAVLGIGGFAVLLLLIILQALPDLIDSRVNRELKKEKRAIRGAKGEEAIGEMLDGLNEGFHILHDIRSTFGNIDHIVISQKGGVFLIETKAHGGRVDMANGTLLVNNKPPEKDFLSQILSNTYWLRDEIASVLGKKPWITPILVFTNAFVPRLPVAKGVVIINRRFLKETLTTRGKQSSINHQVWEMLEQITLKLTCS